VRIHQRQPRQQGDAEVAVLWLDDAVGIAGVEAAQHRRPGRINLQQDDHIGLATNEVLKHAKLVGVVREQVQQHHVEPSALLPGSQ